MHHEVATPGQRGGTCILQPDPCAGESRCRAAVKDSSRGQREKAASAALRRAPCHISRLCNKFRERFAGTSSLPAATRGPACPQARSTTATYRRAHGDRGRAAPLRPTAVGSPAAPSADVLLCPQPQPNVQRCSSRSHRTGGRGARRPQRCQPRARQRELYPHGTCAQCWPSSYSFPFV